MPKPDPTPKALTKEELFDQIIIRRWEEPEARKLMSQTHQKLSEVLQQLKTAQASCLMRCDDVYKERLAEFYVSQLGAVELTLILLTAAKNGILFAPKGWLNPPPKPEPDKN